MDTKYYFLAKDGSFYISTINAIPDGAVEVSYQTYVEQVLMPPPVGKVRQVDETGRPCWVERVVPPPMLRGQRLADIKATATRRLAQLSSAYPDGEVQSWAQQTREAEALAADPHAPAPLLSAIAAARGLAVTELASRVLAKVQAYAAASGAIIGQRQALEDAIAVVDLAAPDAAERLAAIQWPEVAP